MSKLRNYIEKFGGAPKFAKAFGFESPTVRAWLRKDASPRSEAILKILEAVNGNANYSKSRKVITYLDILKETGHFERIAERDRASKKGAKKNAKRN